MQGCGGLTVVPLSLLSQFPRLIPHDLPLGPENLLFGQLNTSAMKPAERRTIARILRSWETDVGAGL